MRIIRYDKSKVFEWNEFVISAKNGLFLFLRSYMDYHETRFRDHSLMIYKNEKLIALFVANETNQKIFSHGGLTFGGLIMSFNLKASDCLLIFEEIIKFYKKIGIQEIYYKAIPSIYHKYLSQEDLYALFRLDAIMYRRDISSAIDLINPFRFSESKRQAILKCKKEGIVIIENDHFEDYWLLLENVLSKFNVKPVHTIEEIKLLKSRFPLNIRLFEARLNNELLAGIVIYDYANVAHTQYMANSNTGRKWSTLDFINSRLIEEEFKSKRYYSFGGSSEKGGKFLNEGLIQQKEMMGGRALVNDFYKIQIRH